MNVKSPLNDLKPMPFAWAAMHRKFPTHLLILDLVISLESGNNKTKQTKK